MNSLPAFGLARTFYRLVVSTLLCAMVGGCIVSTTPVISPSQAKWPFGDYLHLQQISWDEISHRWTPVAEAAVNKKNNEYVFNQRGKADEKRFIVKPINVKGLDGEAYLAQVNSTGVFALMDKSASDKYYYAVMTVEKSGFIFKKVSTIKVYEMFQVDCKSFSLKSLSNDTDCLVSGENDLMNFIGQVDWTSVNPDLVYSVIE